MQERQLGILHCTGEDAALFLQGQLTADIHALTDTQGTLACYLNLKGRVVALMCVIKRPDGFWLILPQDLIEPLLHKLKKFIVFSKAKLIDISDQFTIEGLVSSAAAVPTYHVGSEGNEVEFYLAPEKGLILRISPSSNHVSVASEFVKAMFDAGIPWIGLEQSEKFLPHYINLVNLNAIAFDKGCFVGQEVVARMHYRGHLNKKLLCINDPVSPDDELVDSLIDDGKMYSLVSRKS
ncbi:MAG: YgfZ/GcvT domain-containing protein [Gammaproteobacteria bacterium]